MDQDREGRFWFVSIPPQKSFEHLMSRFAEFRTPPFIGQLATSGVGQKVYQDRSELHQKYKDAGRDQKWDTKSLCKHCGKFHGQRLGISGRPLDAGFMEEMIPVRDFFPELRHELEMENRAMKMGCAYLLCPFYPHSNNIRCAQLCQSRLSDRAILDRLSAWPEVDHVPLCAALAWRLNQQRSYRVSESGFPALIRISQALFRPRPRAMCAPDINDSPLHVFPELQSDFARGSQPESMFQSWYGINSKLQSYMSTGLQEASEWLARMESHRELSGIEPRLFSSYMTSPHRTHVQSTYLRSFCGYYETESRQLDPPSTALPVMDRFVFHSDTDLFALATERLKRYIYYDRNGELVQVYDEPMDDQDSAIEDSDDSLHEDGDTEQKDDETRGNADDNSLDEDEIREVMSATDCTRSMAMEALRKYGNLVDAIMELV